MTLAEELNQLADLRAKGALSDEEFTRAKERLLHSAAPHPGDSLSSAVRAFRRSRTDRWLGGVCGGIARSTGTEAWVWRLIFTALCIWAGAGLLVYLLLWIFVPAD